MLVGLAILGALCLVFAVITLCALLLDKGVGGAPDDLRGLPGIIGGLCGAALGVLVLLALADLIALLIDVESNTRRAAESAPRRAP